MKTRKGLGALLGPRQTLMVDSSLAMTILGTQAVRGPPQDPVGNLHQMATPGKGAGQGQVVAGDQVVGRIVGVVEAQQEVDQVEVDVQDPCAPAPQEMVRSCQNE